jgi:hypothetical protein
MESARPRSFAATVEDTVARSHHLLIRIQTLLTSSQAMIDATRLRIRDSRTLIADANTLRIPAAHPVQSREGFLPAELIWAA